MQEIHLCYHCEWVFPTLFGCPAVEELIPKVEVFLLIMGNLESVRVTLVSNYVLFTCKRKQEENFYNYSSWNY